MVVVSVGAEVAQKQVQEGAAADSELRSGSRDNGTHPRV